MYCIQNLTNSTIKFQGITIGSYATVSVGMIYDYVTLSRLSNSGKIRYSSIAAPKKQETTTKTVETKVEPKKEQEEVKPIVKLPAKEFGLFQKKVDETKKEEPIEEKKEEVEKTANVEEVEQTTESTEVVETSIADSNADSVVEEQTSKTTRRGRKSKK